MIEFVCVVQEGCIPENIREDLANGIVKSCNEVLGEDQGPIIFHWREIAKGLAFRGGYPSTTSQVKGKIPDGCSQENRELLMKKICDSWSTISGTSDDDAIIGIRDATWQG